jgi:hypothetical protein
MFAFKKEKAKNIFLIACIHFGFDKLFIEPIEVCPKLKAFEKPKFQKFFIFQTHDE